MGCGPQMGCAQCRGSLHSGQPQLAAGIQIQHPSRGGAQVRAQVRAAEAKVQDVQLAADSEVATLQKQLARAQAAHAAAEKVRCSVSCSLRRTSWKEIASRGTQWRLCAGSAAPGHQPFRVSGRPTQATPSLLGVVRASA